MHQNIHTIPHFYVSLLDMSLYKCQAKAGNAQLQGEKESSEKHWVSSDLDGIYQMHGTGQLMATYFMPR